jgi:hypothetical protein
MLEREVHKRPLSMLDVKRQLQSIEDSNRWKQRYTLAYIKGLLIGTAPCAALILLIFVLPFAVTTFLVLLDFLLVVISLFFIVGEVIAALLLLRDSLAKRLTGLGILTIPLLILLLFIHNWL